MTEEHKLQTQKSISEMMIRDKHEAALHKTLDYYQAVITRMAENSRHCKTWSVTLTAGILLWSNRAENPRMVLFCLIPAISLGFLDTYYLYLEQQFRKGYNQLVTDFHHGSLSFKRMYVIKPVVDNKQKDSSQEKAPTFFKALRSFAIWPYYLFLILFACLGFYLTHNRKDTPEHQKTAAPAVISLEQTSSPDTPPDPETLASPEPPPNKP